MIATPARPLAVAPRRGLILALLLAVSAVLLLTVNPPREQATPRFAADDASFQLDGWRVSAPSVEGRPGVAFVSRELLRLGDGARASVVVTTSPQAKLVYRAGADVPLLGNGYAVETAPANLVTPNPSRTAQIARRGSEAWLQLASFGERRGNFSNGVSAWSLAVFDTVLGNANDYYLARIVVPFDGAASAATASELADTLLPRIAAYYAG